MESDIAFIIIAVLIVFFTLIAIGLLFWLIIGVSKLIDFINKK